MTIYNIFEKKNVSRIKWMEGISKVEGPSFKINYCTILFKYLVPEYQREQLYVERLSKVSW